jgi:hypothetical protein
MRELLVKYMMNVIDKEGISFLYQWNDSEGLLSETDYGELKKIETEAIENLKKHYEQNKN